MADFALAHQADLEAIGHVDQIDAILKRVGKFDAKPVFPSDDAGEQGLLQWIKFNADRGLTVGSFFHSHAPSGDDLVKRYKKEHDGEDPPKEKEAAMRAATKGNDPDRYVKTVAEAMGTTADAIQGKALSDVDATAVARAIKEKGEGWIVGTEQSIDVAIANTALPAQARFRLLYTKWSKKK